MAATRLRRFSGGLRKVQLAMGVGFFALVLGFAITSALVFPLQRLLAHAPHPHLAMVLTVLLGNFWAYAVLPLLGLLLGRVATLNPWPAAVGAVLTGEGFLLALRAVLLGAPLPLGAVLLEVGLLALGAFLTQAALKRGARFRPL